MTEPGRVIGGRYRLVDRLGSGAFGQVWRAYDMHLGVDVAVKQVLLPMEGKGPQAAERVARAAREARNTARLRDCPNIVTVHDVHIENGAPWIVMQLVKGESLAEHLTHTGPLTENNAVALARDLLRALAAAHAAGIVHRDVKPGNVLLAADGTALLADFGIAVRFGDDQRITRTGTFIGSPGYVAPERVISQDAGAVGDLFSLGATLYEAVEGIPAFRADVIGSVVAGQPAPMRRGGRLTPLITRLLDKDPATRPDVAAAFALVGDWTPPPTVEAPGSVRALGQDVQLGVEWVEHFAFVNERLRNDDSAASRVARAANAPETIRSIQTTIEVNQNEYLAAGGREVHAVVTVSTADSGSGPPRHGAAAAAAARADRTYGAKPGPIASADGPPSVVFIADCSRSLAEPGRLAGVKAALHAGIEALPDGARFAVIAGRADSQPVYPEDGGTEPVTAASRAAAKSAVDRLSAYGGREIGLWLSRAARMFALGSGPVRHAILIVNGKDEGLHPSRLALTARACAGLFTADCLGLGEDWEVHEMRLVSDQLSGTMGFVPDAEALPEAVREATAGAVTKRVADVELSLWTPSGAVIRYVKQVSPLLRDLTDNRIPGDAVRTVGFPTGAWGEERREFHICVEVAPGELGQEKLAARVQLTARGPEAMEVLGEGKIRAVWTDDETMVMRVVSKVGPYTGAAEPEVWLDPEIADLERELAGLADELSQAEAELAEVRNLLTVFGRAHARMFAPLLAELDEIEARIAEVHAARSGREDDQRDAETARERAQQSARQADEEKVRATRADPPRPAPTGEAKRMYRKLARRCHPDLADDEADRQRREVFMARVNDAYTRGDIGLLAQLSQQWDAEGGADSTTAPPPKDPGARRKLKEHLRQALSSVHTRLDRIRDELTAARDSELGRIVFAPGQEAGMPAAMRRLDTMADKLKTLVDERRRVLDGLLDAAAAAGAAGVSGAGAAGSAGAGVGDERRR
ncbi:protein kinase [Catenulispora sp. NF23]|uniref:protein kinase domain-containing protein n=1 Tax=Catenulispora pinistramenti TaxID=2705254 RepID=UPI001BAA72A9|nr:serine/threonine-protein kinase [Catenulispora pinistramenti]MBS2532306.1 protein kinase [Catenulispora pinistramenti]